MGDEAPVRGRLRLETEQRARLAVLPGPGRDRRARRQVRRQVDDLEPAVRVRDEDEAAVGQPAHAALPVGAVTDPSFDPVGDRHDRDPRRVADRLFALPHDRQPGPVRGPLVLIDVEADRRDRARAIGPGRRCRSPASRDGRIDDPHLGPAAAARDERDAPAVGRPARGRFAGRVVAERHEPSAVRIHDRDRPVADERQPPSVGRPARIRDVLLGRRDLRRRAARAAAREQLARPGRLERVGHDRPRGSSRNSRGASVPTMCSIDRASPAGPPASPWRRRPAALVGRLRHVPSPAAGQPTRAHHGPTIARWARTWPWRSS